MTFDGCQIKKDVARAPGGRIMFSTVTEGSTFEKQRVLVTKLKDNLGNVSRRSCEALSASFILIY